MTKEEEEGLLQAAEALISLEDHLGYKILMAQINVEVREDLLALSECEPTDHKTISELQVRIKGLKWLRERRQILIEQGLQPETLEQTSEEHFDD